jgi:type I restriction enzyme S subunit
VKYALDILKADFLAVTRGTTQDNLSLDKLLSFPIWAPPIATQDQIGGMLQAYDDLIENNTRRIAILEEMARRIFEEWFVHFRAPGCEGLPFVDSLIGRIPQGWDVLPMENVCSRITDGAHKSPASCKTGVPMASVKDMRDQDFELTGCRGIAIDDYEELVRNDCKPLLGDVLIAKDGSYLKHVFVVREQRELAILSSIAILRPNGGLRTNLMVQFLKDPSVTNRMKGYVSGVAVPRIVLRDFRQFPILVPPAQLQDKWEMLAGPILQLAWQLTRTCANLRAQRDLLLPKLISGEIDLSKATSQLQDAAE